MTLASMDEPRELIQQLIPKFHPAADCEVLRGIRTVMEKTEETRSRTRDETKGLLKALSRRMELAKTALERPVSHHGGLQHSDRMVSLDREKFGLAKGINEVEHDIGSLEMELEQLQKDIKDFDAAEEGERYETPDQTVIKLNIYRQLGVELIPDSTHQKFAKVRIISTPQNDIHTLPIEDTYSRFFYANYLWETCT